MVWDPETKWWYGVRGNDEYLFRFRPPRDPRSHLGEIEGLAPFGFRPSKEAQPRFASLGMAHLMAYDLDTRKVTGLGPIVTDGRRRVSEIHSLAAGSDGKLHAAAMVWSIEGQDPANAWGERAGCYFHSRFMTIDPKTDFKNQ